jgi:hypothetical protein
VAPDVSSPLDELVELEPVLDFPQSQESEVELLSSFVSHPSSPLELELEDDDDELLDELEELDDEELPLQLSLLSVEEVLVSVAVVPHPSSAIGASSPVSS